MYCAFWLLQYLTDDLYSFANTKIPEPEKIPYNTPNRRFTSSNLKSTQTAPPIEKAKREFFLKERPATFDALNISSPSLKNPLIIETPIEMIPMPALLEKTTRSQRQKNILEVWEIFKTIYSKVIPDE